MVLLWICGCQEEEEAEDDDDDDEKKKVRNQDCERQGSGKCRASHKTGDDK